MIKIQLNKADYEYDIYGLIQAFFPGQELFLDYKTDDGDESDLPYQVRNRKKEENEKKKPDLVFYVNYSEGEKEIEIRAVRTEILTVTIVPTNPFDRPSTRNELKRGLYELCHALTGKNLPWGTLTGIRPTKVPLNMLYEGYGEDEIRDFMRETYLSGEEKIELGLDIAKREKTLLANLHTNGDGYSLYVGIPFCPTTCLYCSFPSYGLAEMHGQVDDYLSALKKEILAVVEIMHNTNAKSESTKAADLQAVSSDGEASGLSETGLQATSGKGVSSGLSEVDVQPGRGMYLDTIYMGGGTPTSLTAEKLDDLLEFIEKNVPMEHVREFTVEAGRPDSITVEKLKVMKKHGISRISINPQTMNQKTLDLIGRRHSAEAVEKSFKEAREVGFSNINMDVILGLPGETKEDVAYTFEKIKEMKPDNLTVHSLAVKTKSRLHEEWEKYREYAMNNSNELMAMAHETAAALGMKPYYLYRQKNMIGNLENVGFVTPGKEGLYNILIMEEVQTIMACGAGTVSKRVKSNPEIYNASEIRTITRCDTVKDVSTYIDRIDQMIDKKRKLVEA